MLHTAIKAQSDSGQELIARAPAPLLSNYGEGRILQYYLDISVRTFCQIVLLFLTSIS